MPYLFSRCFLGLAVAQSIGIFALAYYQGWNLEIAVLVGAVVALVAGTIAERLLPYRADWNKNLGDLSTDATSAIILVGLIDPLLKLAAPIGVVGLYGWFDINQPTLLGGLPLFWQIVVVTLLIELGRYWSHRLHHRVKPFWWLHAMHHSSQRLYVINTMRFNPLNYIFNFLIGAFPVLLMGPSPEALFGYLALTQPVLLLQHANIDLKSGWLNYVFSSNELHRWHHSTDTSKANANYGNAIVLWDQVFGTFKIGSVHDQSKPAVGLFESSRNYPDSDGYFSQLLSIGRLLSHRTDLPDQQK